MAPGRHLSSPSTVHCPPNRRSAVWGRRGARAGRPDAWPRRQHGGSNVSARLSTASDPQGVAFRLGRQPSSRGRAACPHGLQPPAFRGACKAGPWRALEARVTVHSRSRARPQRQRRGSTRRKRWLPSESRPFPLTTARRAMSARTFPFLSFLRKTHTQAMNREGPMETTSKGFHEPVLV